jgi:copper resistance protein B
MMKKYYVKNLITTLIASHFYLLAACVNADEHSDAHGTEAMHDHGDNPVITKVMFDQLELRNADGANPLIVEAQAWVGNDLNKLWVKTDVEKREGELEEAEVQALYSHAIAPYWDLQMGLRQDLKPTPTRTWGVLGVHGLAPYFFEVDAAIFVGESGKTALRISAEYELLFTQKLILSPELAANLYGQNDVETGTGSRLSDITAGLRLRYEIKREFAPYIGVNWSKQFGKTANMAERKGESASDTTLVAGLRIWF